MLSFRLKTIICQQPTTTTSPTTPITSLLPTPSPNTHTYAINITLFFYYPPELPKLIFKTPIFVLFYFCCGFDFLVCVCIWNILGCFSTYHEHVVGRELNLDPTPKFTPNIRWACLACDSKSQASAATN